MFPSCWSCWTLLFGLWDYGFRYSIWLRQWISVLYILYVETMYYYMVCVLWNSEFYITILVWSLSHGLNYLFFVSCYCSCCIAYVLRHLVPMCGAFVFKCKLLICTHVGGVPLSFVNMVVLTSDIIANPYVVIKHQKGGDWKNISLTLEFCVFDDNMCDTLMCVDMVQNLFVIEFVLRNKKKGAGKIL